MANHIDTRGMGERIKVLRRRAHMTQEQLAERLDVTVKHISSVERGLSVLSLEKLVLLCEMFDTSLDTLVRNEDQKDISIYVPVEMQEILRGKDLREKELLSRYLKLYQDLRGEEGSSDK